MDANIAEALEERATGTGFPFAIRHLADDRVVGWTWYYPDYWRTAVNTECKYLMLRHAFERMGCIRVEFKTDVRNVRPR